MNVPVIFNGFSHFLEDVNIVQRYQLALTAFELGWGLEVV